MSKPEMTELSAAEDAISEEMEDAFWGAYDVAPEGEGVMGAAFYGCRAVVLAARGMKAPEAVAKAIGEAGSYGIKRRYAAVPREATDQMLWAAFQDDAMGDTGTFDDFIALNPGFREDWRRMWRVMVNAAEDSNAE